MINITININSILTHNLLQYLYKLYFNKICYYNNIFYYSYYYYYYYSI